MRWITPLAAVRSILLIEAVKAAAAAVLSPEETAFLTALIAVRMVEVMLELRWRRISEVLALLRDESVLAMAGNQFRKRRAF